MVTSITLIDQDRRRNYELNPIRQRTVPTSAARNVSTTAQAAVRKPLRITSGTATTPSLPWKPTPAIRSESSRPPPILPHHNPEHKDVTCFHCHKAGHIKPNCPDLPAIRLVEEVEEYEDVLEQEDVPESDEI